MTAFPLVWVVGSGGLLGSSVWREPGCDPWRPEHALNWHDATRLDQDLERAVAAFAERLRAHSKHPWAVTWCAGAGVVATSAAALAAETRAFERFLTLLSSHSAFTSRPGVIALASSAGGVYGGCFESPISEETPPAPISPYGRAKLEQERLLCAWGESMPHVRTHVARFSNLYGMGQRLKKAQGLISHASRCVIHGAPLQIYVSLDTIRDYLFAEDAAREFLNGLRRLLAATTATGTHSMKIYASEREISIAGLLGVFRQIARRRLRVIAGLHPSSALQPRRLQFRSKVWPGGERRHVELIEGVSRVFHHQLALFRRGQLPPPPPTAGRR